MDAKYTFTTDFTVRIGDVNYGGHMGNDKYLLLFHDARLLYLGTFGFSEKDIGGAGLIMSEAHVVFKAEVFLGDLLRVGVLATELEGMRFRMDYEVERRSDGRIVATGWTGMVAFDYLKRRPVKIPDVFREKVGGTGPA
jgi:4-hydroxybenzoyl-CoA thioesterase